MQQTRRQHCTVGRRMATRWGELARGAAARAAGELPRSAAPLAAGRWPHRRRAPLAVEACVGRALAAGSGGSHRRRAPTPGRASDRGGEWRPARRRAPVRSVLPAPLWPRRPAPGRTPGRGGSGEQRLHLAVEGARRAWPCPLAVELVAPSGESSEDKNGEKARVIRMKRTDKNEGVWIRRKKRKRVDDRWFLVGPQSRCVRRVSDGRRLASWVY